MSRLLIFVAAMLLAWHPGGAIAANYFVDAIAGNDAFTGTSATPQGGGSVAGPWRTLTKVNAVAFQPGDAVYFRCGQSWRGTLKVASSANPASPIRYSRFGSDCTDLNKPTITTGETLSGWQVHSGNIYVANTYSLVYQLFADGVALRLAQYPNVDYQAQPSARGMMVVDQALSPPDYFSGLIDSELAAIADKDLIGAGAHIRINDFIISDRTVAAFDPANMRLTLTERTERPILANWGYYLDNKLWMLDEPGEFYFDGSNPTQMKVYVWMPDGGAPGSRVVGASANYGIDATGATNVVIEAIRVDKTGVGIQLPSSTNVVVRNVDISDSYYRGIVANNASNGTIENCTIRRSVREGILVGSGTNFQVLNNRVIDSGVVGSPKTSRGAISSLGSYVAIKNNHVVNSGYHGISFGKNNDVANNHIQNVCLVLNDCGGVYTGNSSTNNDSSPHNSVVFGNTIVGVYGNRNGRDPGPVEALTPAIYLDYKTSSIYIASNTVVRADSGMFVHAASNNVVTDNIFYDYLTFAIRFKEYASARITTPNRVQRNSFFALRNGPPIFMFPAQADTSGLASFDLNRYSALYADNPAILDIAKITLFQNGIYSDSYRNLQQWRQAGNDTSGTVFDAFGIAPFAYQPVDGINLLANGTFNSNTSGWIAWASQGDASLAWRSNCPVPGCVALTAGASSPLGALVSGAFPVGPGKTYLVSFSHKSGGQTQVFDVVPRKAGPGSFDFFQERFPITAADTWRNHGLLFTVPSNYVVQPGDYGGRVDFDVSPGQTLYLDNIRTEEVTYVANTPEDDSVILSNTTAYNATFACPDAVSAPAKCNEYVYFDNANPVTWPVVIAPRKSSIVVWAGNPFRRP